MKPTHSKYLTIALAILAAPSALCQQGNNWYFGIRAGVTFNTSPPSALTDGVINTGEGCSTISDNKGQLLFYTDGYHVWNRHHQQMPNGTGLKGGFSSSQAAIIVPRPGSSSIYYIFTSDEAETGNANGYNYSEVDMTLDGGMGDITANKNILLFAPSSEQLTAVRASNGIDAWVVTKVWGNNQWRVYKVDCNGVNMTPVESYAGLPRDSATSFTYLGVTYYENYGSVGCLKPSPDGKMLAATSTSTSSWELFNFDNSTGLISNPLNFPQPSPYGIEFAPNSSLIYVATENSTDSKMLQYNLAAYDSLSIVSSRVIVGAGLFISGIGGLQLGPDNKIYFAMEADTAIGAVNNPNAIGLSCDFKNSQIDLFPWACQRTLPAFYPALLTHANADFSYVVGSDCSTVNFAGSSIVAGTLTWDWDFGDGTTGSGQNVTHIYSAARMSTDTVTLTVSTLSTCGTAIGVKEVSLARLTPVAHFGLVSQCGNLSVLFTDSSTISGSTLQGWNWDFGDGTTSTLQNPTHTYPDYGSYPVKLSVTSAGMCNGTDVSAKTVAVNAKPIAVPNYSGNPCEGKPILFTDGSYVDDGTITQWYWDFGDSSQSGVADPQKSYTAAKTFKAALAVTASSGCVSDTAYTSIPISSNPVVAFSAADTCFNMLTQFSGTAAIMNGTVENWWWDLGDGSGATSQNPSFLYPSPGAYLVRVSAMGNVGCQSDTVSRLVTIGAIPTADFAAVPGCIGVPVALTNIASIPSGAIGANYWDFGDGNHSLASSPSYSYAQYGNFDIKHMVTSTEGCLSDTVTGTVNIQSVPKVDFSFENTCVGKEIQFHNQSTNDSGVIQQWIWDLGNGEEMTVFEPSFTYNQYGDYSVKLKAVTQNGCQNSETKTVMIEKVNISAGGDTTVAIGQPLQLAATGAETFNWTPSTYLDDPASDHPIAILEGNVTYYLTGVTVEGCVGYDTIRVTVYKGPEIYVPNAFTPNGDGHNDILRPILPGSKELFYFSVYNRWGQLVFTTKKPGDGWNGESNGVEASTGTYVWMLKARDYTGKIMEKKGTVLLIR